MNRKRAIQFTKKEFDRHGIRGWKVEVRGNHRVHLAMCDFDRRAIVLTEWYVDLNKEGLVKDTIRHEVAHILAGHDAAHGPKWIQACQVTQAIPREKTPYARIFKPVIGAKKAIKQLVRELSLPCSMSKKRSIKAKLKKLGTYGEKHGSRRTQAKG